MKRLGIALMVASGPVMAAPAALTVTVEGLGTGRHLPLSSAYCVPPDVRPEDHDISPGVTWSPGPPGTRSYVLLMTDLDVPKDLGLINKAGVTIPVDAPRVPFIHWVLVDIPPSITHLAKGVESDGFIPKGRPVGPTDHGLRGANVYSGFYPKDSPLAGPRGGFDGPCPPKNDTKMHRYVTAIYALDVPTLGLGGVFFGEDAQRAMAGHVLATGEAEAVYGTIADAGQSAKD